MKSKVLNKVLNQHLALVVIVRMSLLLILVLIEFGKKEKGSPSFGAGYELVGLR